MFLKKFTPTTERSQPQSNKRAKVESQQPSQSWSQIFSQPSQSSQSSQSPIVADTLTPASPASPEAAAASSSSSSQEEAGSQVVKSPVPKSPIPLHIRQRLEQGTSQTPAIQSVPLSYDSSWLKRSGPVPNMSPTKRPWYSALHA